MVSEIDVALYERMKRASRFFCKDYGCESLAEDFAQELYLRAIEAGLEEARGWKMRLSCSVIAQAWFARSRVHKTIGLEVCTEQETLEELLSVSPIEPAAVIAWHRLRENWHRMSAHEKAGVYCVLTSSFTEDVARELRVERKNISRGRESALERIDCPATFAKKRVERARAAAARMRESNARKKVAA